MQDFTSGDVDVVFVQSRDINVKSTWKFHRIHVQNLCMHMYHLPASYKNMYSRLSIFYVFGSKIKKRCAAGPW